MVAECSATVAPLVVPVWHEGMDHVLPNTEPYVLRTRKRLFLNVGEPIYLQHVLDRWALLPVYTLLQVTGYHDTPRSRLQERSVTKYESHTTLLTPTVSVLLTRNRAFTESAHFTVRWFHWESLGAATLYILIIRAIPHCVRSKSELSWGGSLYGDGRSSDIIRRGAFSTLHRCTHSDLDQKGFLNPYFHRFGSDAGPNRSMEHAHITISKYLRYRASLRPNM